MQVPLELLMHTSLLPDGVPKGRCKNPSQTQKTSGEWSAAQQTSLEPSGCVLCRSSSSIRHGCAADLSSCLIDLESDQSSSLGQSTKPVYHGFKLGYAPSLV